MGSLADAPIPAHLALARQELGVKELAGANHRPRIIEYHAATTLKATADEVPWCAAFVSWVLKQAGIPGVRSAGARDHLVYGRRIQHPEKGCLAIFTRGQGQGHVGFVEDYEPQGRGVLVLGGNQGNAVTAAWYPASRVLGFRGLDATSSPSPSPPAPHGRSADAGSPGGAAAAGHQVQPVPQVAPARISVPGIEL